MLDRLASFRSFLNNEWSNLTWWWRIVGSVSLSLYRTPVNTGSEWKILQIIIGKRSCADDIFTHERQKKICRWDLAVLISFFEICTLRHFNVSLFLVSTFLFSLFVSFAIFCFDIFISLILLSIFYLLPKFRESFIHSIFEFCFLQL